MHGIGAIILDSSGSVPQSPGRMFYFESFRLTSYDLFQGGICFLCIIYAYFRIPEPSGRTFAELDLLFERGISARKFATTKVDVFDDEIVKAKHVEDTTVMEDVVRERMEKRNDIVGVGEQSDTIA